MTQKIEFTLHTFPSLIILAFAMWGLIDATMKVVPMVLKLF